ncbi:hypothetical protein [Vibrio nigripulchritudo]|uniref:hypothetical protein n=1 Tax=Vibrio nigripulchritudo TaxID=28173 RepID=UPI0005FA3B61|nr:hypothetical protein [Vibrio nigripulchritudo]KJY69563.1 hypothetical protein TW74_24195 [Vibrio nigripulchritudo]
MRQGKLAWFISLLLVFSPVMAKELSQDEAQQWIENQQILTKADELYQLVLTDEVDSLEFALQRLNLPQQDVVRFLLLEHMEEKDIILTTSMAKFVQKQIGRPSPYKVRKQGDGYEFTIPAFDSSAVASRLLKRWHGDQQILTFILQAEQQKLKLSKWLTEGKDKQNKAREALLIRELDGLSPKALNHLTQQLTHNPVANWLPSTKVVVRMAQVSEDPEVYKILWRMKADQHTRAEMVRLAKTKDEFSLQQVMLASENPSLHDQALNELTRLDPLPIEVKTFLIKKLEQSDGASVIARNLVSHGHRRWVEQLAENHRGLNTKSLLKALSGGKDN